MWISSLFLILLDSCVDRAKVEESEQKAAEFSKKVGTVSSLLLIFFPCCSDIGH